jgi:hypothetical protein
MPLKLHAIEDWSRKRLVSELGSATFEFDPPMNLGSRFTYVILSSPLSSVRIACFLPLPSALHSDRLPCLHLIVGQCLLTKGRGIGIGQLVV